MNGEAHEHQITKHVRKLYELLRSRDINAVSEYRDGHKHIDIAIPDAHIYIEVDGLQHFTDSAQIEKDFKRSHYSDTEKIDTIHVPNLIIKHHLQEVADAIVEVVSKRLA